MFPIDSTKHPAQTQDTFLDVNSLNHVKAMGRADDPQALKEVAKQFEAIFIQQMLKSMRAANEVFAEDSYFNSNEMQFHQDMYDQQMSLNLTSGRGLGLADAFYEQMVRAYGGDSDAAVNPAAIHALPEAMRHFRSERNLSAISDQFDVPVTNPFATQRNPASGRYASVFPSGGKTAIANSPAEFIASLKPYAEKAAGELNVDSDVLLAQAALETGWGRHVIHAPNGRNSFNLFNIKAGAGWSGDKINVSTLEYAQGIAHQERADFRSYGSYAESFADYVSFIQTNPRYHRALAAGQDAATYVEELQKAGYATDPAYAEKIKNILTSDSIRTAAQSMVALASAADEM